jgi:hypothetical protein
VVGRERQEQSVQRLALGGAALTHGFEFGFVALTGLALLGAVRGLEAAGSDLEPPGYRPGGRHRLLRARIACDEPDTQPRGMLMESGLNSHHRDTIEKIFSHPSSSNIEWRRVLSLLQAVGTATEEHNGKFKVVIGPETEVVDRPEGKDIDQQLIVDLRRMLTNAGFSPADIRASEGEE